MTVSLPSAMVRQVNIARKLEHRTKSELVREALRKYFKHIPIVEASLTEKKALRRGRAEFKRGEYVDLDQLVYAVGSRRRSVRRKAT